MLLPLGSSLYAGEVKEVTGPEDCSTELEAAIHAEKARV